MAKATPTYIPVKKKYDGAIRTAIYCRVSSHNKAQIESLTAQISGLTSLVAYMPGYVLVDTYIDIASGSSSDKRPGFQRLVKDCQQKKIQYVITKSASRFARDIVDALEAIREIQSAGAKVYFETEKIDSDNPDMQVTLAVHLAVAELENKSRSENIQWGMRVGAEEGCNKIYNKVCYGFKHDKDGNLVVKEEEAENVRLIFRLYLDGHSVLSIIKELKIKKIVSPSGKDKWNKHCIEKILRNPKYAGDSTIATGGGTYLYSEHHPAIIERSIFDVVQQQLEMRSNININNDGTVTRKNIKYSGKTVLRKTVDLEQLKSDFGIDDDI